MALKLLASSCSSGRLARREESPSLPDPYKIFQLFIFSLLQINIFSPSKQCDE